MFGITKKTMVLVAVCALMFVACSKSEGSDANVASAQSGSKSTAISSNGIDNKTAKTDALKVLEPKLAEAKDFDYELTKDGKGILITNYKGTDMSIIVPSEIEDFPVTEMKLETFWYHCETLVNVVLPDSLKELPVTDVYGLDAGMFCPSKISEYRYTNYFSALKSVTLPADITYIPSSFLGHSSIESIVIPSKVKKIYWAFGGCENQKTVDIQSNVLEEIGGFGGCTALESIRLPDSVKRIGSAAFAGCTNLKSINLPNGVELMYEMLVSGAFHNCLSLTDIIIPEGATITFRNSSKENAFKDCSSLSIATQARLRELGYEGEF